MKYLISILLLFLSLESIYGQNQEEIEVLKSEIDLKRIQEYIKHKEYRKNRLEELIRTNHWERIKVNENGDSLILVDYNQTEPVYECSPVIMSSIANSKSYVNALYPNGRLGINIKGQGLMMAIWETNLQGKPILQRYYPNPSHQDFIDPSNSSQSRIALAYSLGYEPTPSNPLYSNHAQTTFSNAMSDGLNFAQSIGTAPEASAISYNSVNDIGELIDLLVNRPEYPLVSNYSYGYGNNNPYTSLSSSGFDEIIISNPKHTVCIPIGNKGFHLNLKSFAAKNIIASGLLGLDGSIGQFPTTSALTKGRILPNITATACGYVAYESNSDYREMAMEGEGTSFTSPQLAAGALLLQQYYKDYNQTFMNSTTARALLFHSAKDMGPPGPDLNYGFGHMDLESAAKIIANNGSTSEIIEGEINNTSNPSYSVTYINSYNRPLKVTLVWDDEKGCSTSYYNTYDLGNNIALINDLDLRVTNSAGVISYPFKMDPNSPGNIIGEASIRGDNDRDTYEQVVLNNPIPAETYTITVSIKNNCRRWDLSNPQSPLLTTSNASTRFSLVVTGINNCGVSSSSNILTLTNSVNNTSVTEHANLELNAKNEISGISNDVKYLSGRDIYLQDGLFTHNSNTLFRIQDCPNQSYVYSHKKSQYNPIEREIIYFPLSPKVDNENKEYQPAEEIVDESLRIYPNPTRGNLVIEFQDKTSGTYELRDIQGRLIVNNRFDALSKTEIDMKSIGISAGVYFLIINDGYKTHVRKIQFQ